VGGGQWARQESDRRNMTRLNSPLRPREKAHGGGGGVLIQEKGVQKELFLELTRYMSRHPSRGLLGKKLRVWPAVCFLQAVGDARE
jgi:hypothetical protein